MLIFKAAFKLFFATYVLTFFQTAPLPTKGNLSSESLTYVWHLAFGFTSLIACVMALIAYYFYQFVYFYFWMAY